jgi:hypothetical protein
MTVLQQPVVQGCGQLTSNKTGLVAISLPIGRKGLPLPCHYHITLDHDAQKQSMVVFTWNMGEIQLQILTPWVSRLHVS